MHGDAMKQQCGLAFHPFFRMHLVAHIVHFHMSYLHWVPWCWEVGFSPYVSQHSDTRNQEIPRLFMDCSQTCFAVKFWKVHSKAWIAAFWVGKSRFTYLQSSFFPDTAPTVAISFPCHWRALYFLIKNQQFNIATLI